MVTGFYKHSFVIPLLLVLPLSVTLAPYSKYLNVSLEMFLF